MSEVDANERINKWLEKAVAAVVAASVAATAGFQWQLYRGNEDVRALLKSHDARIAYIESKMTEVNLEVSEIRSQMVGWDTIKRIELFLASKSAGEIDSKMSSALRMELDSRGEKISNKK